VTLDDATVLAAARADAAGFLAGLEGPIVLDEVQRAPELFLAIKQEVDRDRVPGRFLLTGSANILLLPHLSQALVGRMEILTLWPLSQGEIQGQQEAFVDALFTNRPLPRVQGPTGRSELWGRVLRGGYPEALGRTQQARRRAWYSAYLTTLLQRDVRDLANIEGLTEMPRLLGLLATGAGGLLNFAALSRASGIAQTTLKRYLTLLEMTFLIQYLPAWSGNLRKRLVKSPKVYLNDTGLLLHLVGADLARLRQDTNLAGPVLENFVMMELTKQAGWSTRPVQLFHFRTQAGQDVDIVFEDAAGRCVGLEVKSAATLSERDFKGLRAMKEALGKRFLRGVVLYTGRDTVPFGRDLYATPIDALWSAKTRRAKG
jgi:predicted AAA+ superfamily ATPase